MNERNSIQIITKSITEKLTDTSKSRLIFTGNIWWSFDAGDACSIVSISPLE